MSALYPLLLLVLVVLAASVSIAAVPADQPDPPPAQACPGKCVPLSLLVRSEARSRKRLKMARRFERQRNVLRKVQRFSTVEYALRLASVVYGVPYGQLSSVSYCESRHNIWAQNGQYRSLFQEGPMFERGPFGRAGFSVWDPIANALTAGYTVSRGGWSQWECRP